MSEVIKARALLNEAAELRKQADRLQRQAMRLLYRRKPVRRAKPQRVVVTPEMRDEVHRLVRNPQVTMQQISNRVGLRNVGRVSEILDGTL